MRSVYRNKKLLLLAQFAPKCFCCGNPNDGTVVAAHANMQSMGKGMSYKAADIPAYLCSRCHDMIDGRVNGHYEGLAAQMFSRNASAEWAMAAVHSIRWALENHPEVFR